MVFKRVTLFSGHYGSGKTNVAVNFAINLSKQNKRVSIYDLDIVNPYFRTIDAKYLLYKNNVELIVSPYAETNVDIPALNAMSYKMTADKSKYAVVDLGGDDRGALALGRFSDEIKKENNYDFLLVVNCFRPETRDIESVKEIKDEIEKVSNIAFTGIVNNCNLGIETTEKEIQYGIEFCNKLSKELNIPILFTSIKENLVKSVKIENVLPLSLIDYGNY